MDMDDYTVTTVDADGWPVERNFDNFNDVLDELDRHGNDR
jgi:hypothetical protein